MLMLVWRRKKTELIAKMMMLWGEAVATTCWSRDCQSQRWVASADCRYWQHIQQKDVIGIKCTSWLSYTSEIECAVVC